MLTSAIAWTSPVVAEAAVAEPAAFVAVTWTRIFVRASFEVRTYVCDVAVAMSVQLAPSELQRCHWYAYVTGVEPVQVPLVAVSVWPSLATPVTAGRTVFVSASGATIPEAADEADAEATELVAATWTRTAFPTSVEVSS